MYHGRARSSPPTILCPFQTTVYFFINVIHYTFLILKPQELWKGIGISQTANSELNVHMYLVKDFKRPSRGGGGGSHVTHLNFKTSRVSIYKCLLLIDGFAITVAIWQREVVPCCNFILRVVATFWAMSLVGIYPGRASFNDHT